MPQELSDTLRFDGLHLDESETKARPTKTLLSHSRYRIQQSVRRFSPSVPSFVSL